MTLTSTRCKKELPFLFVRERHPRTNTHAHIYIYTHNTRSPTHDPARGPPVRGGMSTGLIETAVPRQEHRQSVAALWRVRGHVVDSARNLEQAWPAAWDALLRALHFLRSLVFLVLDAPLMHVYLNGPRCVGFWEGANTEDICAELTGVHSAHWYQNPDLCDALVERKFEALITVVYAVGYMGVLWRLSGPALACVCRGCRSIASRCCAFRSRWTRTIRGTRVQLSDADPRTP